MQARAPARRAVPLAAAVLALFPAAGGAQTLSGRVVLDGWSEPVPRARVLLLTSDSAALAEDTTDAEGRFAFTPPAGAYHLRAHAGDLATPVLGPVSIAEGHAPPPLELTLPFALYDQARACRASAPILAEGARPRSGVLAGIAYDGATGTPIPGAKVVVDWTSPGGGDNHVVTGTDGAGRFVFCDVAAAVPLRVQVEALGRVAGREEGVRVNGGALARLDLPVDLAGGAQLRVLDAGEEQPGNLATLHGQLLDASTGSPIAGAEVSLEGLEMQTLTDETGRFRLGGVPPGDHRFAVQRLGYDWSSTPVTVAPGASMVLELRAAPRAVELEAIVVRATTPEMRMARGATQAPRVVAGSRLLSAQQRSAGFLDIVQDFPSLRIRQGRFETPDGIEYGTCIESSRAMVRYAVPEQETTLPWCEMIAIVIDGVATVRGTEAVNMMQVRELESIEFLPPLGAIQYGKRAAVNGALVVWTRGNGPHVSPERSGGG